MSCCLGESKGINDKNYLGNSHQFRELCAVSEIPLAVTAWRAETVNTVTVTNRGVAVEAGKISESFALLSVSVRSVSYGESIVHHAYHLGRQGRPVQGAGPGVCCAIDFHLLHDSNGRLLGIPRRNSMSCASSLVCAQFHHDDRHGLTCALCNDRH